MENSFEFLLTKPAYDSILPQNAAVCVVVNPGDKNRLGNDGEQVAPEEGRSQSQAALIAPLIIKRGRCSCEAEERKNYYTPGFFIFHSWDYTKRG